MYVSFDWRGTYIVFHNEAAADKWQWLFTKILRRKRCCYAGFFNGYILWERS